MTERIIIQCPGCSAKLGLSDASKLGKKIRCSKCSEVFVAQALKSAATKTAAAKPKPAPAKKPAKKSDDDEFNFDDTEMEDKSDSEEDEQDAAPVRSKAGGKKVATKGKGKGNGKGKGKKKSGVPPLPLIIGGAVAAVLLLGVLGFFLLRGKKEEPVAAQPEAPVAQPAAVAAPDFPNDRILALKWMPAETELILHLKIADAWSAPLLKGLLSGPQVQDQVQKMQLATGLAPSDIDSVTIGVKDLQKTQQAGAMMALGGPPPTDSLSLIVIRSKKPVDPSKLLSQLVALDPTKAKVADHNGKPYLEAVASPPAPAFGSWFADSNTLISGTTTELFAAMDRGETNTPRAGFRAIDATSHFVIAMCPTNPQSLTPSSPQPPGTSPAIAEMQKAIQESMTAFGLGVSATGGVSLKTSVVCKDSASSGKIKAGIEAAVTEGKSALAAKKGSTHELLIELGEILLNNIQVADQNQVASINTNIPDSAQQKLEQLPTVLMGAMLTAGLGGGLGGGGFNPPAAVNNPAGEEQAKNNLKEILLAFHTFHNVNGEFPPAHNVDSDGKPLLSWRVHILPLIGQDALYKQFHLNEPWDSEHNRQFLPLMPATYASSDDVEPKKQGQTRYVVPVGSGMAFEGQTAFKIRDFSDGTSTTIMAVEVASDAAVEWTKPEDLTIDLDEPFRNLGGSRGDHFLAAFADGRVLVIKNAIVPETLKAIFTRKGGEVVMSESF